MLQLVAGEGVACQILASTLSSGADAAPRSWRASVVGPDEALQRKIGYAANALMAGRVLRPSYGWQLASKAGAHLPAKMLTVNDLPHAGG